MAFPYLVSQWYSCFTQCCPNTQWGEFLSCILCKGEGIFLQNLNLDISFDYRSVVGSCSHVYVDHGQKKGIFLMGLNYSTI